MYFGYMYLGRLNYLDPPIFHPKLGSNRFRESWPRADRIIVSFTDTRNTIRDGRENYALKFKNFEFKKKITG